MERRSILPPGNGQLPSHVDSLDKDDSDISLNEVLLMRIWIGKRILSFGAAFYVFVNDLIG